VVQTAGFWNQRAWRVNGLCSPTTIQPPVAVMGLVPYRDAARAWPSPDYPWSAPYEDVKLK
jgi:hypothetical protein